MLHASRAGLEPCSVAMETGDSQNRMKLAPEGTSLWRSGEGGLGGGKAVPERQEEPADGLQGQVDSGPRSPCASRQSHSATLRRGSCHCDIAQPKPFTAEERSSWKTNGNSSFLNTLVAPGTAALLQPRPRHSGEELDENRCVSSVSRDWASGAGSQALLPSPAPSPASTVFSAELSRKISRWDAATACVRVSGPALGSAGRPWGCGLGGTGRSQAQPDPVTHWAPKYPKGPGERPLLWI